MERSSERGSGSGLEAVAAAAGVVFVIVVLYVASIGPVARICRSHRALCREAEPALEVVYAPVIWLGEDTPMRRPLDWYVRELWGAR